VRVFISGDSIATPILHGMGNQFSFLFLVLSFVFKSIFSIEERTIMRSRTNESHFYRAHGTSRNHRMMAHSIMYLLP